MTVQGFGAGVLTALMRGDRRRDADSSWLLFGPTDEPTELDTQEEPPADILPWRYAAE